MLAHSRRDGDAFGHHEGNGIDGDGYGAGILGSERCILERIRRGIFAPACRHDIRGGSGAVVDFRAERELGIGR
jgi:hypothetical protein